MEFFKEVADVLQDGQQIRLPIRKTGAELAVSILSDTTGVKDKAVTMIVPIVVSGTPEDFEDGFANALNSTMKAHGLVTNIKEFEESVEAARKASEMAKKEKDEKEKLRKEFNDYISLARQNLAENKFLDAKKCLEKASVIKYADKSTIEKVKQEIVQNSGEGNMFGGPIDKSDGKNLIPLTKSAKPAETKMELEDNNDNQEEE